MKKLISSIIAMVLAVTISIPVQARDFVPEGVNPDTSDEIAVMVKDAQQSWISLLFKETTPKLAETLGNRWCLSLVTESCAEKGGLLRGYSILPVCVGDATNCIEDVQIYSSNSPKVSAVNDPNISKGFTFSGDSTRGIPDGDQPSLWNAPGVPNADGETKYVVSVGLTYALEDGVNATIRNFSATVFPVVELTGSNYFPSRIDTRDEDGVTWYNHDNGERGTNDGCVLTDNGKCWARTEFNPDTRVGLSLRLTNQVSGWLHGRVDDAVISVEPIDKSSSRVTVDAAPMDIPVLYSIVNQASLKPATLDNLKNGSSGGQFRGNRWAIIESDGFWTRGIVTEVASGANDTAAATYTSWRISSLQNSWLNDKCFDSKSELLGLITTNALAYSGFTPEWDGTSLNYQVAGLHYAPDGKVQLGSYNLIMRSDVARCMYGFSKAPISATVAVVGTGDQNIATTIVSEKDGWLKLAAEGFTFSEKEIQVKVTQAQNKTLTKFSGSTRTLTSKQKAEIKAVVTKAKGNPKFICTGVYVNARDKVTALKRARAACDYAKSLDKDHSYWAQAKQSKAKSYDAKVMIVSK